MNPFIWSDRLDFRIVCRIILCKAHPLGLCASNILLALGLYIYLCGRNKSHPHSRSKEAEQVILIWIISPSNSLWKEQGKSYQAYLTVHDTSTTQKQVWLNYAGFILNCALDFSDKYSKGGKRTESWWHSLRWKIQKALNLIHLHQLEKFLISRSGSLNPWFVSTVSTLLSSPLHLTLSLAGVIFLKKTP